MIDNFSKLNSDSNCNALPGALHFFLIKKKKEINTDNKCCTGFVCNMHYTFIKLNKKKQNGTHLQDAIKGQSILPI